MQERSHLTASCTEGGLNTEILVAVLSVLTLKLYNSFFLCMFLAPTPPKATVPLPEPKVHA